MSSVLEKFMLENTFLSLSGNGYLHDLHSGRNGVSYATLNLIQGLNGAPSDDLWVECRFNKDKFPILAKLDQYLSSKRTVILKFDAKYSGFQQCYSGMSENDPRFILHFHAELLKIHDYHVEGINTFQHIHGIEKHRILHRQRA